MKKKYKAFFFVFLTSALCGCTTQTVEDAKNIEETNVYAYTYEYETDSQGEVKTQFYENKPSEYNTSTEELWPAVIPQEPIKYSPGTIKYLNMNDTFEPGNYKCSITEAIATTDINYGYEILDSDVVEPVMKRLKRTFENGKVRRETDRIVWVKVHTIYDGTEDKEVSLNSKFIDKDTKGQLWDNSCCICIDQELDLKGLSDKSSQVILKAGSEQDFWLILELNKYDKEKTYYLVGTFGYVFNLTHYSGNLVEVNIEDKG